MAVENNQTRVTRVDPQKQQQAEYHHLKPRLDEAQLERTIAVLHQSIPDEAKARDVEATLRRMFERAKRWEN